MQFTGSLGLSAELTFRPLGLELIFHLLPFFLYWVQSLGLGARASMLILEGSLRSCLGLLGGQLYWQRAERYYSKVVGGLPNKNYGALDTILRDYIILSLCKQVIGFHFPKISAFKWKPVLIYRIAL
jgi:hypothetical protein